MEEENPKPRTAFVRQVVRQLLKNAGVTEWPVRLKVLVDYLREERGLEVYPWDLDRVSGLQTEESGLPAIAYNQNHHPHRQRFTVAHEIGHLLLGHTHSDSVFTPAAKVAEREAHLFAAEILMPRESIRIDVVQGLGASALAQRYRVSEDAMWVRLKECRLIDKLQPVV